MSFVGFMMMTSYYGGMVPTITYYNLRLYIYNQQPFSHAPSRSPTSRFQLSLKPIHTMEREPGEVMQ